MSIKVWRYVKAVAWNSPALHCTPSVASSTSCDPCITILCHFWPFFAASKAFGSQLCISWFMRPINADQGPCHGDTSFQVTLLQNALDSNSLIMWWQMQLQSSQSTREWVFWENLPHVHVHWVVVAFNLVLSRTSYRQRWRKALPVSWM